VVASRVDEKTLVEAIQVSIPFIAGQWSLRARAQQEAEARVEVSIPFIAGQWSLPDPVGSGGGPRPRVSQSPSLRGSGRFSPCWRRRRSARSGLNPLHCGAVVASRRMTTPTPGRNNCLNPLHCGAVVASEERAQREAAARKKVSIPFIAGQWSLPVRHLSFIAISPAGLNPLHCGAVVASCGRRSLALAVVCVSIPFIAGQWSLLKANAADEVVGRVSQSPSLRGSGRFPPPQAGIEGPSGSVSIPFIAGQWSLPIAALAAWREAAARFNPLHCGAVVASGAEGRRAPCRACFNPLHCGAVVASHAYAFIKVWRRRVSIPFIAGQWSLRAPPPRHVPQPDDVSIPFIAGQWSLLVDESTLIEALRNGFNPLHCGAVVASTALARKSARSAKVSIPFIAGQWSLPPSPHGGGGQGGKFQSPSLRGSGRFVPAAPRRARGAAGFNPLHCGAVVASPILPTRGKGGEPRFNPLHCGAVVASKPWLDSGPTRTACFNPLHCGAVVASSLPEHQTEKGRGVSIPFIAGQWSLRLG